MQKIFAKCLYSAIHLVKFDMLLSCSKSSKNEAVHDLKQQNTSSLDNVHAGILVKWHNLLWIGNPKFNQHVNVKELKYSFASSAQEYWLWLLQSRCVECWLFFKKTTTNIKIILIIVGPKVFLRNYGNKTDFASESTLSFGIALISNEGKDHHPNRKKKKTAKLFCLCRNLFLPFFN